MAVRPKEWQNRAEWQKWLHTYYLRYTHTDNDNDDDTLIFYSIDSTPKSLTTRVNEIGWDLWYHNPGVLTCSNNQMGPSFNVIICWQECQLEVSPIPSVTFQDGRIPCTLFFSNCTGFGSKWGTGRGAFTYTQSIQVLPSSGNS